MVKKGLLTCLLLAACVLFAGCEKVVIDDESEPDEPQGNVVLRVSGIEQMTGTVRNAVNIADVCSRLTFAVYKNGDKVKAINQKKTDAGFGEVNLTLGEGDYEVLIIGHSGVGSGNPNVNDPANVLFSNLTDSGGGTGYSDTFYFFGNLSVGAGQTSQSYLLKRASAMFRLVTTDAMPSTVRRIWFYIEGACKGFDATKGVGVYNAREKPIPMYYDLDSSYDGKPLQIDVFAFICPEASNIKITVRALSAANGLGERDILYEREFEKVSMQRNTITQYTGALFGTGSKEPDTPDDPQTPDNPQTPDSPDNPDNPDIPDSPDVPDTPDTPDTPSGKSDGTILVDTDWLTTNNYTF